MKRVLFLFIATVTAQFGFSQTSSSLKLDTSKSNRMEWWREARFGMFVHWGVYSVPAGTYKGQKINRIGEWIMNRGKISVAEYQQFATQFNPVNFNADEWVKMAKDAGMKYIVITAKHHDGFAMFRSNASKWNIVDATPYGKDVLKQLAEACKKYGIRLGFYYSQAQDWNNPGGAASRKPASEGWANPDSATIDAYTAAHNGHWDPAQTTKTMDQYMDEVAVPQVKELLTNYGDVAVLWWDTPTNMTDEYAAKLDALLSLQPMIITNDRLKRPNYPGDYKTPEQRIPNLKELDGKDWETCMTMNETWGYKSYAHNWKSVETLVRNLIDIASKGGNYLLNVGPKSDGTFPQESVDILKGIGAWMKVNSEAIYGTGKNPLDTMAWGRITSKPSKNGTILYLSVFDWPKDGKLSVPGLKNEIISSKLLASGESLKAKSADGGWMIKVPEKALDPVATVIRVEVKGAVSSNQSDQKTKMKTGELD
jgi:alpha-L-fucosidase